jgi:hypothetical protein
MAPVAHALRDRGLTPTLLFTGQHPLDPAEFDLELYLAVRLNCPGEEEPHGHVRRVRDAVLPCCSNHGRT